MYVEKIGYGNELRDVGEREGGGINSGISGAIHGNGRG